MQGHNVSVCQTAAELTAMKMKPESVETIHLTALKTFNDYLTETTSGVKILRHCSTGITRYI